MKREIFRKILLVVDGSDEAIRASKYAIMLAGRSSAELTALYVVDSATIKELLLSRIFIEEESKEYESSLEENGKKYLHLVSELADAKKVSLDTVLERGSIYGKVIEIAMERGVDLIVVGARKRGLKSDSASRGDLLSAEYTKVLRESPVSVLFAKGDDIDKEYKKF